MNNATALFLLSICTFQISFATAKSPNIVVIMADDLGYGDVGCYGAKPENIETPHIDQLAAEGIRFTNGYCSASTCTPTRYAFLTGTHAFRVKGTGIAGPNSPALIHPDIVTLPDLLQKAGYKTAVIGKWHLGLGTPEKGPQWNGDLRPGPLEIGFDCSFLLPTTNDRVPQVYVENHRVLNLDPADPLWVGHRSPGPEHPTGLNQRDSLKMDWSHGHNNTIHNGISRIGFYTGGHAARFRDEDLADKWVEKSKQWIIDNKGDPFFLFFASHDLHVPRMPHERFHGNSRTGLRGDSIVQLDWCVGELVKMLKEQGLEENTMIVFCSDNGPVLDDGYKDDANEKLHDHKPAGPYAGGKYKIQEGGTRTPFITWWPGTIKPAVSEQMVCTIDLATSLANHLGVPIPENACLDSLDVMDALVGKEGARGRTNLIQQDNGRDGVNSSLGYRAGKWKLQRLAARKPKKGKGNSPPADPAYGLYDLDRDPAEKQNLKKQHPEVFERMKAELQKLLDDGRSRLTKQSPINPHKTPTAAKNKPASPIAKHRNTVAPTFKDAKYGIHEKELMNFWQFKSEKPVGVLLKIHGGGWMGGKKDEALEAHQVKQGFHVASISYPLVNEGAVQPAMLNAALRAVQFIRYKARDWNIDHERIAVTGGSAGGCSSLLVALHDDVADPDSNDPVKRFSSRVSGAVVAGAQTTMNPFVIKERIGEKTFGNPMPYKPFGAETAQELMDNWDQYKELALECSPLTHLSKDDPPLHLFYNVNREFPTTKSSNGIHSPIFGEIMLEACKKIGVECHLQYWEKDKPKPAVSRQQFLERLLLAPAPESQNTKAGALLKENPSAKGQPNLLWIVTEDIGCDMGCYGTKGVFTPHIDQLAAEGALYTRAYTTASVCSPSRSSFMTGLYPHQVFSKNMRIRRPLQKKPLPEGVDIFTRYLRDAGYTIGFPGHPKKDWGFLDPKTKPYDTTDWDELTQKQPFFCQYQFYDTHRVNKRRADGKVYPFLECTEHPVDSTAIELHPYTPDSPEAREELRAYLENVNLLDTKVGKLIDDLKAKGLYEDTIIVLIGDNGPPIFRGKGFLYERGIRMPLIVRVPERLKMDIKPGSQTDEFVSALDMAPTFIDLAGGQIPDYMEGRIFFGPNKQAAPDHLFAMRDRHGMNVDRCRSVCSKDYKYIRNYVRGMTCYENSLPNVAASREGKKLFDQGKLPAVQTQYFKDKPKEELYELKNDPFELNNLAQDPAQKERIGRFQAILAEWCKQTGDDGEFEDPAALAEMDRLFNEATQARRKK